MAPYFVLDPSSNQSVHAYQNKEDLISKSCRATPYPKLCESTLRAVPHSSTADTHGLALIMVDVVKTNFNDTITYVNNLIGKLLKWYIPMRRWPWTLSRRETRRLV
ncbi:hypothetical protein Droror1_Dr00006331 [Drosera rotundifolia]